jgi:hypothetical protein
MVKSKLFLSVIIKNGVHYIILPALASLMLFNASCGDDGGYPDVDGQAPQLQLTNDHIRTAAGRSFTLSGNVSDKDGIATIRIECPDLNLNKTIDLIEIYQEPLETYELSYSFNVQRDEIGESFTIKITVTDVGERTTAYDVLVTMDGDFENPVFTVTPDKSVTVLIKTQTKFSLSFSVADDRALDYIIIEMPGIESLASRRVEANGEKQLSFKETIVLPNEVKSYNVAITAVDKVGNRSVASSVISVSEMPDFEKMYLADVATVEQLNSDIFGVPMRIEHTGEYSYKANYYCEQAGTEIFFLPQKSDFAPICFGLDPDDNSKLTDDPETARPIVLSQANVYYEITFNTSTSAYAVTTYSIADAIDPVPHEYGSISLDTWFDGGSWLQEFYFGYMTSGPKEVTRFVQDKTNPHLYYLADPLFLEAGKQMNFLIHNWHHDGWWNYCTWRVDNAEEPETFGYYGDKVNPAWTIPNTPLDNWTKPTVNVTGSYKLIFDAHLGRGKLVPAY